MESTTNNAERIANLQTNIEFLKDIATASSADEFVKVFSKYGITISDEEAEEAVNEIARANAVEVAADEVITEADLENVSGGCITGTVMIFGYAIPKLLVTVFLGLVGIAGVKVAYSKLKKMYNNYFN